MVRTVGHHGHLHIGDRACFHLTKPTLWLCTATPELLHGAYFRYRVCSVAQSCPTLCDPMDCSRQAPLSLEISMKSWGLLKQTPRSLSSSVKWAHLSYCFKGEEMREPSPKHGWLSPGAHFAADDVTPPAPAGDQGLGNWEGDSWTHCRVYRAELETLTQLGSPVGCFVCLS